MHTALELAYPASENAFILTFPSAGNYSYLFSFVLACRCFIVK